jgi:hypothetical protein
MLSCRTSYRKAVINCFVYSSHNLHKVNAYLRDSVCFISEKVQRISIKFGYTGSILKIDGVIFAICAVRVRNLVSYFEVGT